MWKTDSSASYLWERKNIVFAIRQAREQAAHWRTIVPPNRWMDLSYEDLVGNPEKEIRAILKFCDLPWEERCLTAHGSKSSIRTISVWQARQPIYQASVDRWKRYEPWLGEFAELLEDRTR
jgi:hypothetical protein